MKVNDTYKVIAVIVAFAVVCSTCSFTIKKHFCGETLVDVALFSKVDGCCDLSSSNQTIKSCCKNEVEVILGKNKLSHESINDLDFQWILVNYLYSRIKLFESLQKPIIPHENYTPPNLVIDIQLLDDVFLI